MSNTILIPNDFMFQLTKEEDEALISQFAISKGRGVYRKLPFAFGLSESSKLRVGIVFR